MIRSPKALLVNPWVCDFKAFDFWNKPLGLLIVARILQNLNFRVTLLDCMDRNSKYYRVSTKTDLFGRGKYSYEIIEKPSIYRNVPRYYKRYGLPKELFSDVLKRIEHPDIIFVTSTMTYWYPGVFDAIQILKHAFPKEPIVLGGIYASLCTKHAREKSGADIVLQGPAEEHLTGMLAETGFVRQSKIDPEQNSPDFSLYGTLDYGVVLTSRGCPFECTYCATKVLCPQFQIMPNEYVIEQLSYFKGKTRNIAFFDDALLYNSELPKLLDAIIKEDWNLQFHTSNGLHCRFLDHEIAEQMYRANFKTMYLSLETTNPRVQKKTGGKVRTTEFIQAVETLKTVGFSSGAIHAYILYGMPEQEHEEIMESIRLCHDLAINPHLCEFSPIPYTEEYKKTGFDENTDPLYHNNLFYTWYYPTQRTELYKKIKKLLTTSDL